MEYVGKIYRPWMEAESFLLQVTYGCSHNTCTFCTMFDDKRFRIRPLADILREVQEAGQRYYGIRSVFLIDGNVLVLKTEMLLKILEAIRQHIPTCERVAMYATFNDLRRKTVQNLKDLSEAGLDIVYAGLESGDPDILKRVKKDLTPEQALEGMAHAKEAGLAVHNSLIFGLGGREGSQRHIEMTTDLLNRLQPEEISTLSLSVQPNSELEKEVEAGSFVQVSPLQLLQEELYLLENITFPTLYWGDHGNNIVAKRGYLPEHQAEFVQLLRDAIAHHPMSKAASYHPSPW
ncbi:MAG: radical SAM protein [Akkermansia sp.]